LSVVVVAMLFDSIIFSTALFHDSVNRFLLTF
jgi:hypothetical protein